jgi:hypothetical protein
VRPPPRHQQQGHDFVARQQRASFSPQT